MHDDYMETLGHCEQITLEKANGVQWYVRVAQMVLNVFAPLL